MKILTPLFERVPMVWFLLGLLFFSAGLYLGFDYTLSFWYMIIGSFCCAYGVAVFLFRIKEKEKASRTTTLSPHFISMGSEPAVPTPPPSASEPAGERTGTD